MWEIFNHSLWIFRFWSHHKVIHHAQTADAMLEADRRNGPEGMAHRRCAHNEEQRNLNHANKFCSAF